MESSTKSVQEIDIPIIFTWDSIRIFEYKNVQYILSARASRNGEYLGWSLTVQIDGKHIGCISKCVSGCMWDGDLVPNAVKLIHEFAD